MLRWKKLIALLAVSAMMTATVSGCGAEEERKNSEVSESSSVAEESSSVADSSSEMVEEEFSYPMEGRTLTITCYLSGTVKATAESKTDTTFTALLEEKTGIELEYTHDNGNTDEWFSMMFADGEYTDIIEYNFTSQYAGGLTAAYEDGVAICLNDVIDQYMPNFKSWLEENPSLAARIQDENGNYYGVPSLTEEGATAVSGIIIRQDWLDELGLSIPDTIDEWHETLVAIKDAYGITPIVTQANPFLKHGAILNAYAPQCISNRYSVNAKTGAVEFTQATDGYKEFITTIAQWYEEGLIDKDFITYDSATVKAKILNNEGAVLWGYGGSTIQTYLKEAAEVNPELNLSACPIAAKEEGAEILYNSAGDVLGAYYAVITPQCEDVEAAARYLDYFFSEEGHLVRNFGEEGVSYTMENGVPTYTDLIQNNPEGLTVTEALGKYTGSNTNYVGTAAVDYLVGYYASTPQAAEAIGIWSEKGSREYTLPSLGLTSDENEAFSAVASELNTYADETIIKFVLGTEDIETGWDAYVENCKKFGMEDAVAIQQAAYDRIIGK